MRLFVLGATGRTGVHVLDIALARGHDVTAFVRSPDKIQLAHDKLRVVTGDPRNAGELGRAMRGHDAVLTALGPKPREAFTRTTLLADCAATTIDAMRATSLERVVTVSSAILFDRPGLGSVLRVIMGPHVRDLRAMEAAFEASGLDWTFARPPRLVTKNEEAYRSAVEAFPFGMLLASLPFRAVAAFMLDAIEGKRFIHERVGLAT
jgi:putative NADH-flavin reductase